MHTYPPALEEKLGFDVIRAELKGRVKSTLGEDRVRKMRPADAPGWLEDELQRVDEYARARRFDEPVPLRHVLDLREALRRAAPEGAYLDPPDLRASRLVLITLRKTRRYFRKRKADYPALAGAVERITPLEAVEEHVESILDEDGRVRDNASPKLQSLRQKIDDRQARLRDKLREALRSAVRRGFATEEQPTLRGGRHVIPVRAEAKRKIEGFVHDVSASGQTVYIEPAACLELGNEVRELEAEERREIERILREATALIRDEMDAMQANVRALAQLDLLQAKARLMTRLDAHVPTLSTDGVIDVRGGRNPVLQLHFSKQADGDSEAREVVPLSLRLGDDHDTLVITGPNAGGKTVAMKTVGLFALMLAYGLPLPADEESRFPLFHDLIADIGDEQSIEDDLSTFSSHVGNLRHMLGEAGGDALVLIDEAGTGTDPDQGGALAQAVLERLTERGARTIATTHHGTLKAYAHDAPRVQNGSMAFDQETLQPTYHFRAGVPGSSYAFEIAERMGLSEDVLARARALAGAQKSSLEDLITTFEKQHQEAQRRLAEAEDARGEAEQARERYAGKARKMEKEKEEIRRQALEQAERIVQGANARIERVIREIKEAGAEQEATQKARERFEDFRQDLAEEGTAAFREDVRAEDFADEDFSEEQFAEEELSEEELSEEELSEEESADEDSAAAEEETPSAERRAPSGDGAAPGAVEAGDQVLIDGEREAEVAEVEGEEAVVLLGAMRMRVDLERLARVGGPREQQVSVSGTGGAAGRLPALRAKSRLDLRGKRVHEARPLVEELIDEASAAGLQSVEILHGKGTGALRAFVHEYLAGRADVEAFADAPFEQGGTGVTRVTLA